MRPGLVREWHNHAMALFDEALIIQRNGDEIAAIAKMKDAYFFERMAAELLPTLIDAEPTRSILYRSAASIALLIGEHTDAIELAQEALRGTPPSDIRNELLVIVERAQP